MNLKEIIAFWNIDYSKLQSGEYSILFLVTLLCILLFISSIIGIKNINYFPEHEKKKNEFFLNLNINISILLFFGCGAYFTMIFANYITHRK